MQACRSNTRHHAARGGCALPDAPVPRALITARRLSARTNASPDGATVSPLEAYESGKLAFGFSAGGLLFPYYVGMVERLQEMHVMNDATPLAGASAGSLIAVTAKAGVPMSMVRDATLRLAQDCRDNGTRFRLRAVLEGTLREVLPRDIHERANGRAHLAVTRIFPGLYPQLISEFSSREDVIQTMLTSCHIPWYFDGKGTTMYRGAPHTDGGITNFLPSVPGCATVRVCCLPSQQMSSGIPNIHISPDTYKPWDFSLQQMLAWALEPADQDRLLWLFEEGRQDAETWAVASGVAAAAGARGNAGATAGSSNGLQDRGQLPVVLPLIIAPAAAAEKPVLLKLFDSLSSLSSSSMSSASSIDEGDDLSSASPGAAAPPPPPAGTLLKEGQQPYSSSNSITSNNRAGSSGSRGNGSSGSSGNGSSGNGSSGSGSSGSSSSDSSSSRAGAASAAGGGGSWGGLPEFLGQLQKKIRAD